MGVIFLLILAAIVLVVVVVPIIGLIVLIRRPTRIGIIIAGACALMVGSFFLYAHIGKRSSAGRIVRYSTGAGIAQQETEDQAEDLRRAASFPQMQNWANETLRRFRMGEWTTNAPAENWYHGVQLPSSEIPDFLLAEILPKWKSAGTPELSIGLSASGAPESVVIAWYSNGIAFGGLGYESPISKPPHSYSRVSAGVYTYYFNK